MTTGTLTPAAPRAAGRLRPVAVPVARVLLGLAFLVFGLNGFLDFLPHPETPPSAGAGAFLGALAQTATCSRSSPSSRSPPPRSCSRTAACRWRSSCSRRSS